MIRSEHPSYRADLSYIASLPINWSFLADKTVAISGATGMLGTVLVDALLYKNDVDGLGCKICALGRDAARASERLPYEQRRDYSFEEIDISSPEAPLSQRPDVIFHLASPCSPRLYATQPISVISANVLGAMHLLDSLAPEAAFVFASSSEIYGENRGDVERVPETYMGHIDCNTLRAGYSEAKRTVEALCRAYESERGVRVSIPRFPRCYGPTLLRSDNKAHAQFLWNAHGGQDVVLKSQGTQCFSYLYAADAIAGMLWIVCNGVPGEAYNLADGASDVTLRELAGFIAKHAGVELVFDLPSAQEQAGYSVVTKALLDPAKLQALGWKAQTPIEDGIAKTMALLRDWVR